MGRSAIVGGRAHQSRTATVPNQSRTATVPNRVADRDRAQSVADRDRAHQSRTATVPPQSRTATVPPQSRTATVPTQSRTATGAPSVADRDGVRAAPAAWQSMHDQPVHLGRQVRAHSQSTGGGLEPQHHPDQ